MNALKVTAPPALALRLLLLAVAVALAGLSAYEALSLGSWAKLVSALGWLALGAAWYLSPVPLNRPLKSLLRPDASTAIGSGRLRALLTVLGVLALVLGLTLRYGLGW